MASMKSLNSQDHREDKTSTQSNGKEKPNLGHLLMTCFRFFGTHPFGH
jgi:hypothetical protein